MYVYVINKKNIIALSLSKNLVSHSMLEYQDMHCLLILICIMKYLVALARAIFVPRA
jgi:hypothetical protein